MSDLPKITVVTPSLNQGEYLETCLCSVLDQSYPKIEYIVVDGGSEDASQSVLKRYRSRLSRLVIEPDDGHYDAVNKGFAESTGGVMGFLNADDRLLPGALHVVGEIFRQLPEVQWITSAYPLTMNAQGRITFAKELRPFSRKRFLRGGHLRGARWHARDFIQQESTFWRRELWDKAGGKIDTGYGLAGDFDLWMRFFGHAELYTVRTPLGVFRSHSGQRSRTFREQYVEEATASLMARGGKLPGRLRPRLERLADTNGLSELWDWILDRTGLVPTGPVIKSDDDRERWIIQGRRRAPSSR